MITISNSELTCYQRCPKEWEFRYVLKKAHAVAAETLRTGSAIHMALAGKPVPLTPIQRAMVKAYEAPNVVERDVFFLIPISETVAITGEFDAIVEEDGQRSVLETKTTSRDISIGSYYWRHVVQIDSQASMYLLAAKHLGLGKFIFWDALRKPMQRQKKNETEEQFEARVLGEIRTNRAYYQQRRVITRFDEEITSHVKDILGVVHLMMSGETPRNRGSCFAYERPCDFFEVCAGEADLNDDGRFVQNEYVERRESKIRDHLDGASCPYRDYEPAAAAYLRSAGSRKIEPGGEPAEANPYRF